LKGRGRRGIGRADGVTGANRGNRVSPVCFTVKGFSGGLVIIGHCF